MNAHHFPMLVQRLRPVIERGDSATVWSAGCSTGEEAHALAMALADAFGDAAQRVRIVRHENLLDDRWPVDGPVAAIFCRDAIVHFDEGTQLELLKRFAALITGGGALFAGHSENYYFLAQEFLRPIGRSVYEAIE